MTTSSHHRRAVQATDSPPAQSCVVPGEFEIRDPRRQAPAGKVAIHAIAPFGNIEVLVPDGVQVDVGGFTLFGSKSVAVADTMANVSTDAIRVRGSPFSEASKGGARELERAAQLDRAGG